MRVVQKRNWYLLLLLILSVSSTAQNLFFQVYSIRDGLAASKVYCIQQDVSGKVWLGTVNGVSLFDGYQFQNFTTDDGLAPDGVRTAYRDSSGAIWFGHFEGGISRFRNGKFEQIHLSGLQGQGHIYDFLELKKGEMWIASNGFGAIHISNAYDDADDLEYNQFMGAQGLGDRVFDLSKTLSGNLFFVTDVGLRKLIDDHTFEPYQPGGMSNMFQLTCMLEDRRGMQWFGTHNGGLYRYSPGNSDIEIFDVVDGLAHNFVFCLQEDHEGNIWAGTYGGGISVINPNGSIRTMSSSNGLPDDKIQSLATDHENNILIGTNDNGLLVFKSFQFEHFPLPDQVGARRFNALTRTTDGSLWIGTEKGLIKTDPSWQSLEWFAESHGLSDPNINAIAVDKSETLWVGTEFGGLFSFSPDRSAFQSHYYINQYITQYKITDLCVDADNNLWIGTLDGLLKFEIDQNSLERFSQRDGLPSNHVSAVAPGISGDVLVGLVGRGALQIQGEEITTLVPTGTPSAFMEDNTGAIWIGMEGEGIHILNPNQQNLHLTRNEGLISNAISSIDQDEWGMIWIGSAVGISKLNPEDLNIQHFEYSAGFSGVEIRKRASLNEGNQIWYGTANGVFRNRPALEKQGFAPGELLINKVMVENEPMGLSEIHDLKHNQNELEFSFLAVSLTDPQNVWYRTRLEGRDDNWTAWTKNRSVLYNGLPEGVYRLHVEVRNRWNETRELAAAVDFEIHPPWYRSTTFYVISIIFGVVSLVLFIKLRERTLKREKLILEEKVRLRTKEVVEKSEELEKKNNDILDSINYARRIQEAILIPHSVVASYGIEAFILYQPKDIVSGDFYWFNKIGDKVLFAAADCTGHGVPGAFMSVVGYSLLDKIAIELKETQPEVILQEMSFGVERFLRQKENDKMPKDGMDMALGVYDQRAKTLDFAGAFNPLYLVRNGELTEFKGDRFSVGSYDPDNEKQFEKYSTEICPGDCVYVFSDGFVDQFGGPDYKKFKSRQFKKLLITLAELPLHEQQSRLESALNDWMGDVDQLDDILVIGIRF